MDLLFRLPDMMTSLCYFRLDFEWVYFLVKVDLRYLAGLLFCRLAVSSYCCMKLTLEQIFVNFQCVISRT